MHWDIGIDLGTENVRAVVPREGVILDEAALLVFRDGRELPAFGGKAAREIYGKTCDTMHIRRPLRDGVLENSLTARHMIQWVLHQSGVSSRRKRLNVLMTCAPFTRPVQQEALMSAALEAGASVVALVRSDAAAAIGAGLDYLAPEAKMVIEAGAGKISATLFTLGIEAAYSYLPYGMNRIDERIQRFIRARSGFRIGKNTAEEIKRTLGSAQPEMAPIDVIMHMIGFCIDERLPRRFDVETEPVLDACEDVIREMENMCTTVVDNAPEELSADLNDIGAVLTGEGAELTNLDRRIGNAIGIPCRVASNPGLCCARGLQAILEQPDIYDDILMTERANTLWR